MSSKKGEKQRNAIAAHPTDLSEEKKSCRRYETECDYRAILKKEKKKKPVMNMQSNALFMVP